MTSRYKILVWARVHGNRRKVTKYTKSTRKEIDSHLPGPYKW